MSPFGRLHEEGFGSGKLLALSDAAWRMWGTGLIYCQINLTDGFIPEHAIHSFGVRATNKARVADELCKEQVHGKDPLWKRVKGGFQVHDYLHWNDSRDEIIKARALAKDRQRKHRGQQERHASSHALPDALRDGEDHALSDASRHAIPVVCGSGEDLSEKKGTDENPTTAQLRRMPRVVDGPHLHHALCGRPCMHRRQFADFVRKLGGDERAAEQRVTQWFDEVTASYDGRPIPIADEFKFWNAEYDRKFGTPATGKPDQKSTVPNVDQTASYLKSLRADRNAS